MKKNKNIQFIPPNGHPEWVVVPYDEYVRLSELDKTAEDIAAFQKALDDKNEELIDAAFAERLISGENAIKVWREYRNITQQALAELVGISVPYLSQLENEMRSPSLDVLKKIAETLNVKLDDIS